MTTATEMIKASINRRPGRMVRLLLTSRRRREVPLILADIAGGFLQEAVKDLDLRPGEVLNRIARESRGVQRPARTFDPAEEEG